MNTQPVGYKAKAFDAHNLAFFVLITLLLTACSLSSRVPPPDIVDTWQPPEGAESAPPMSCEEIQKLFAYDANAPLDIQEVSRSKDDGLTVIDLTYASPKGGHVPATLVIPEGRGPFAGIVYQHGAPGVRQWFIHSAKTYARMGAVVLLIDAPFARRSMNTPVTMTEQDRFEQIQLIVDLRRGVDLLLSRPEVDPERLAYIGVSYGGAMGGLLAGVEDRLKAYVLRVGDGGWVTHLTGPEDRAAWLARPADERQQWVEWMWPIEPVHYVGCASPAALFFQNGTLDVQVPPVDALCYQRAGSEPKKIQWYKAGHGLPPQAFHDQADWLRGIIGIASYRMAFPSSVKIGLAVWLLLTLASLCFLVTDLRRTQPVPGGAWFMWILTTLFMGPLGVVIYWLSFRQAHNAGEGVGSKSLARRALGSAAWAAAGTMSGVVVALGSILFYFQQRVLNEDNLIAGITMIVILFLVLFGVPFLVSWLSLFAFRWLSRSDDRFLKDFERPFRTQRLSTLLALLAGYFIVIVLIARYFARWTTSFESAVYFDLSYPPLWAGFCLAALTGVLVTYPLHLMMIRRGVIHWGKMVSP